MTPQKIDALMATVVMLAQRPDIGETARQALERSFEFLRLEKVRQTTGRQAKRPT